MCAKLLIVLVVILQQFGTFSADVRYSDMYPDISNCFDDINRKPHRFQLNSHSVSMNDCAKEDLDESSLCFKQCILKRKYILVRRPDANNASVYEELFPKVDYSNGYAAAIAKIEEEVEKRRIGYFYGINALDTTDAVGLRQSSYTEERLKNKISQLEVRLTECENLDYLILKKDDDRKCKHLDPKTHENIQKLITCMEDSFNQC